MTSPLEQEKCLQEQELPSKVGLMGVHGLLRNCCFSSLASTEWNTERTESHWVGRKVKVMAALATVKVKQRTKHFVTLDTVNC